MNAMLEVGNRFACSLGVVEVAEEHTVGMLAAGEGSSERQDSLEVDYTAVVVVAGVEGTGTFDLVDNLSLEGNVAVEHTLAPSNLGQVGMLAGRNSLVAGGRLMGQNMVADTAGLVVDADEDTDQIRMAQKVERGRDTQVVADIE